MPSGVRDFPLEPTAHPSEGVVNDTDDSPATCPPGEGTTSHAGFAPEAGAPWATAARASGTTESGMRYRRTRMATASRLGHCRVEVALCRYTRHSSRWFTPARVWISLGGYFPPAASSRGTERRNDMGDLADPGERDVG